MDKLKSLREVADYIISSGIEMVNFMYPAVDGRLKTLNFTVNDEDYLLSVLRYGERVDGSSLFPFIEAGNSDLYVIPRLKTMFLDPFSELPTACFLCAFLDKNGRRLDCSPEYTLLKARDAFRRRTGMDFEAMGELEFYVCAPEDDALAMYPATDQKGYHESAPFAKFNDFRTDCMHRIRRRPAHAREVDNTQHRRGVRAGRELRPEDHGGQGRLRLAYTHAYHEGRQEHAGG